MEKNRPRGLIVSDSNMQNFSSLFNNDSSYPSSELHLTPFGQVMQTLLDKESQVWQFTTDFLIIWASPEKVIESFQDVLNYKQVPLKTVIKEVDEYASMLSTIKDRAKTIFVASWIDTSSSRGFGFLDMKPQLGVTNILMHMNLRLAEELAEYPNIFLLNTQKWIEAGGVNSLNPKLWYMGKIIYGNDVFKEATKDIKAALAGISGESKKIIILDLDDTLWGGIVGDLGWENLNLGGHDPIGEAFVDFQNTLKILTNRGIILGIVSKNEESVAIEAIKKHPEMVLKIDDFAGWRINWRDKAQNISDLLTELNLGIQSAVFIDDNPVERARVKDMLPEIYVPDWPNNKLLYKKSLLELRCFDTLSISEEDRKRTTLYASEKKREGHKKQFGSISEWLKTLEMEVTVSELNESNKQRTIQLFNKTNQMNLSTRRLGENELTSWATKDNHKLWTFKVSDKFGDAGLTGILSLDYENNHTGNIVDFILSCRVMGRKIEETMLYTAYQYAKQKRLKKLSTKYLPTAKNKPCLNFWQEKSGFSNGDGDNIFEWNVEQKYPLPDCITLSILP